MFRNTRLIPYCVIVWTLVDGTSRAGGRAVYPGRTRRALVREGNKVTGVQAGDDILERMW